MILDHLPSVTIEQTKISRRIDVGHGSKFTNEGYQGNSKEKTPQNLTPKFIEKLVGEVLGNNKIVEMFQAMAIVSMNMGNLGLEIQFLKVG